MELRFIRETADEQNLFLTRKPNGNFYSGFISTLRLGIFQKRLKKKKAESSVSFKKEETSL